MEQILNFIEIIELVILLTVLLKSHSPTNKQKKNCIEIEKLRRALRSQNEHHKLGSSWQYFKLGKAPVKLSKNFLLKASNENTFSLWATKFPLQFCHCGAKETIDNTEEKSIPTKFYLQSMSNLRAQCLLVPDSLMFQARLFRGISWKPRGSHRRGVRVATLRECWTSTPIAAHTFASHLPALGIEPLVHTVPTRFSRPPSGPWGHCHAIWTQRPSPQPCSLSPPGT